MKTVTGFAFTALLSATASLSALSVASAADLAAPEAAVIESAPSPIDVAFGVKFTTDYVFRGITQSDGDPAVQGYAELQAFDWVYAGIWSSSVNGFVTDPSAEVDLYAGLRHTWDAFTLDVGGLYYYYPGEAGPKRFQLDYWEIYAKPSYAIGDLASITGNVYWTSDYVNTGADATYLSAIAKVNLPVDSIPDVGFYVSGELGKQWIGKTSDKYGNVNLVNYLTWNAGIGATYKAATIEFRYSDSDLSRRDCFTNGNARYACGDRYMVSLSFDTAFSKLK
ncbi:TorF family putative porin [Methylopila sp. Yamaguchi]|uniref:TorF family putative porin n=1 Tax=Methylopila sp. Yamaguchi TaxID=1437817 RepID=UPI000CCC9205|nr:TorF family putative porin [Methylopila sp. Yamaguchi]